jgi:asparagine synthase (glutamine-hydrolysing)
MLSRMHHRGPDDEGVYQDHAMGLSLGCRRLSIIDLPGGRQPLANEDGTIWATLNGEIYNHPALRRTLTSRGHRFATGSDTEVLVHLYEEYGDAAVHAIDGMFAFAIWDVRRRRLLLGRDRFGEKPLFFAEQEGGLVFASELSALVQGTRRGATLDGRALDAFFVHGYVPGPSTIVAGVRQLPPAHTLSWDPDAQGARIDCYWRPPEPSAEMADARSDMTAELRRVLEASVRGCLIADVPIGVLLSGGVDSSLLAAMVARQQERRVRTFTVDYDVGSITEAGPARLAADAVGAEHHPLTLTSADIRERVPRVLGALDQPLADQALVPLQALCEFARSHATVLIGGEGADELFGGYPRYRWLMRAAVLSDAVPDSTRALADMALRHIGTGERSRRLAAMIHPHSTLERHLEWVTDRRRAERAAVYGPRLREFVGSGAVTRSMAAVALGARPGVGAMMRVDQAGWLPDNVLAKADRAGMMASVEIRAPFLHREVAELAASVPPPLHVQRRGKSFLRALLAEISPRSDTARRKVAFRAPAAEWLRGALAPVLQRQIEAGALVRDGWFSPQALQLLTRQHIERTHDHTRVLWPALSFGLWLEGFPELRSS